MTRVAVLRADLGNGHGEGVGAVEHRDCFAAHLSADSYQGGVVCEAVIVAGGVLVGDFEVFARGQDELVDGVSQFGE